MLDAPRVTVVCITYNHEAFLGKALDSFVSQVTDFPFQILVGNDCSTDGTAEVLARYASRYPDLIIAYNRDENMGAQRNLIDLCSRAESEYIAFCEGDDYWIDERKLQKQYDLMESRKDLRACFHDTEIVFDELGHNWFLAKDYSNTADGKLRWSTGHKAFSVRESYEVKDYIPCGFVHTSSMFFRWDYSLTIPEWYFFHYIGDYTIWALQVGLGQFGYINETMSAYRKNAGGCYDFSSREDFWNQTKEDWISIDDDLWGYFQELGAPDDLLSAIAKRRDDDLVKLLKAKYRKHDFEGLANACSKNKEAVERLSGLSVPLDAGLIKKSLFLCRVSSALKLRLRGNRLKRLVRKLIK